jgi:hypothetical protein
MLRLPLTLLSVVLAISTLQGQEAIFHNSMFAVGKLSEKWHYRAESHLVRGDLLAQSRQLIMRPNVIFSLTEKLQLSGGITSIYNASYEGGGTSNHGTSIVIKRDDLFNMTFNLKGTDKQS